MISIKKYIILALIFSTCFITSCKEENEIENIEIKTSRLPNMTSGGVSIGMYGHDGEIESDKHFNLKKGESFSKILSVGNLIEIEREYKIILFVDYKQRDFIIDDKKVNEHSFLAKENETITIPFEIDNIDEGLHDVFFVIVKYSNLKSMDEEYRKHTDMNNILFKRFSLKVEEDTIEEYSKDNFTSTIETNFDGVFLSKEKDVLKRWLVENSNEITDGEINFYVHVGNTIYNDGQEFAVITLLDWEQINFYDNKNVVFLDVNKGEIASIPSQVKKLNDNNLHDLVSIVVYNPYSVLNINNDQISTGIRVGIDCSELEKK